MAYCDSRTQAIQKRQLQSRRATCIPKTQSRLQTNTWAIACSPRHFCFLELQVVSTDVRLLSEAQRGAGQSLRFHQNWVCCPSNLYCIYLSIYLSVCLSINLSIYPYQLTKPQNATLLSKSPRIVNLECRTVSDGEQTNTMLVQNVQVLKDKDIYIYIYIEITNLSSWSIPTDFKGTLESCVAFELSVRWYVYNDCVNICIYIQIFHMV